MRCQARGLADFAARRAEGNLGGMGRVVTGSSGAGKGAIAAPLPVDGSSPAG